MKILRLAVHPRHARFYQRFLSRMLELRSAPVGGAVGPSQEIYSEVRRTIKSKTVIASVGNLAASGGYYIAAGANKIVANPGTITGSIGVIMEFIQLQELLGKIGVGLEVVTSGEFKDIGSPHRKMTEKDRELLLEVIDDIQDQFVEAVARGRNLSPEKVREIADGRIFTGARAKDLGLVDNLGNFHDAVALAKKMTGIQGEVQLVYPKKERASLLDLFMDDDTESLHRAVTNYIRTRIEYRWDGF